MPSAVARKKKGGKNRRKSKRKVAKIHARVASDSGEHHHQVALKLVRRYGFIAVESLSITNMLKNDRLARAISDVGWGDFLLTLRSKAESAGVAFVEVNARGTTQECIGLRSEVVKDLSSVGTPCALRALPASRRERGQEHPGSRTPGPDGASGANVGGCPKRAPRSRRLQPTE